MKVEDRAWILFGLLLLLGTAAGLAWHLFASTRYATFELRTADPVSGLIADSPVEFHGVEVGKVRRVQLVDPRSVSILLNVRRDAPVTKATVATITARGLATRGFTGYVYVALEDSGVDRRPLAPLPGESNPLIPTTPSQTVTLDTSISDVKQDVQQLTDLLHTVLDEKTVGSLKSSVDDLRRVTQVLATNSQRLDAMISSAERTTRNTEQLSHDVRPLLESSQQVVKTTPSDAYLLKVWRPCDLRFAFDGRGEETIGVSSTGGTVSAGLDSVIERSPAVGRVVCPISEIRKVDYRRMLADERRQARAKQSSG
jgi:phospholipid/cholesterol/gamma-HCH transport system substrate-binding protein